MVEASIRLGLGVICTINDKNISFYYFGQGCRQDEFFYFFIVSVESKLVLLFTGGESKGRHRDRQPSSLKADWCEREVDP
jgi:hypothetical protein